jgi:Na+/proline symporter
MQIKEKVAYIIGSMIVIYGAYAGKDLTDTTELIEGTVLIVFFLSVFIIFYYMNGRGIGEWHRKYTE